MFKKCSICENVWDTRDDFLGDSTLELIGYQVDFTDLRAGYFLFNHTCKTTLAIHAGEFFDLYEGPVFEDRKTGGEECPGYCLRQSELGSCPAACECAFVREIIGLIENRRKKPPLVNA